MAKRLLRVGVREFREELAQYLESPAPVAVTRHGRTVGYYIPTHAGAEEDLLGLRRAVEQLEAELSAHAITEDEVVRELRARRQS